MGTAHEIGIGMLLGLGDYLRHMATVLLVMLALAFPIAAFWGRLGLRQFAAGVAPSQPVALGTQSSVASLPVMLKSAQALNVSDEAANVTLPLAVSIFRFVGSPLTLTYAVYAAAMAGMPPSLGLMILCAAIAVLMEFAAAGLPNQVNLVAVSARRLPPWVPLLGFSRYSCRSMSF